MEKLDKFKKISDSILRKQYDVNLDIANVILKSFKFSNIMEDKSIELSTCSLRFLNNESCLEIVKPLPYIAEEDIFLIESLDRSLSDAYSNIVECLISCEMRPDLNDFFNLLNEEERKFEFLSNYIAQLEKLGIMFNINKKEQYNDIAINCQKYIKFIEENIFQFEQEIDVHIEDIKKGLNNNSTHKWFDTVYRRSLINGSIIDLNKVGHIVDWFNSLNEYDILDKSLSVDKAVAKANDWVIMENQRLGISDYIEKEGLDVRTIRSNGSYSIVHLLSSESKIKEGQKMKNCIGTHYVNATNVYSVRYNGKRVASYRLALDENKLLELKGPCNESVNSYYHEGVQHILEQEAISLLNSVNINNIGLCKVIVNYEKESIKYLEKIVKAPGKVDSYGECRIQYQQLVGDLFHKIRTKNEFDKKVFEILNLEIMKKAPQMKLVVEELIRNYVANYEECIFTGYIVGKGNQKTDFFKKLPKEYFDVLVLEYQSNKYPEDKINIHSDYDMSINYFIKKIFDRDLLRSKVEFPEKIYFYIESLEVFPAVKNHEVLYRKIINTSSVYLIYRDVLKKLGFEVDIVNLETKLKYWVISEAIDPRQVMNPWQARRHVYDCNRCNNDKIVKELVYKESEISKSYDSFDLDERDMIGRILELDQIVDEVQKKMFDFANKIWNISCFDYISGKIHKDAQLIKNELKSVYNDFYDQVNWKQINQAISIVENEYLDLKLSRDSYGDEISSYIKGILEINPEECMGCGHCLKGYVIDPDSKMELLCEHCDGDHAACDHAEKIKDFQEKYEKDSFLKYYKQNDKEIVDDLEYLRDFFNSVAKAEDLPDQKLNELVEYILQIK